MYYEYECECGNVQEEMHGMNESPEILCGKCSKKMSRVITGGSGVIFKGGGWPTADARFKQSMTNKSKLKGKKAADHQRPVTSLSDLA